jgi:hypothetical protein
MWTGLDFKSVQFDQVRGEAENWIKIRLDLKSSSVRIGEFKMTSHTNKALLKVGREYFAGLIVTKRNKATVY